MCLRIEKSESKSALAFSS